MCEPLHLLIFLMLSCQSVFFRHLKLELLTQFPASNDAKMFLSMKNMQLPNRII